MNEKLIKDIIKYKLTVVGKLVNILPKEISSNVKNLGGVILEGIKECSIGEKSKSENKEKKANGLNNITIE